MVPYFKKYTLEELDGDAKKSYYGLKTDIASIQNNLDIVEQDDTIRGAEHSLKETVDREFDPEINLEDLAILYEITGHQAIKNHADANFWGGFDS